MAARSRPGRGILLAALCLAAAGVLTCLPVLFLSGPPPLGGASSLRGTALLALEEAAPAASAGSASRPSCLTACGAGLAVAALISLAASRRGRPAAPVEVSSNKIARSARGGARGGAGKAPLVVIAGPPAAGKGTQCEKIKEKYGYVHISTGDILRENVKNGTELGLKAKGYMESGQLVPSELIVDLVKDRLQQPDIQERGCLLDGFPRAPDQAKAMVDAGLKVQRFLLIEVPDETLVERGCGRRLDPETGDIFHLKFKPPPAEIVGRLVHRKDDQEDTIRTRLQTYHSQIDGILPFFKDVVVRVDGTGKPDAVFSLVSGGLDTL